MSKFSLTQINYKNFKLTQVERIFTAADFGFLPTASASDNVAAWNSIPCSGIVNITTAGIYEIDSTLYLCSDTTYNFVAGVTFKKVAGFSSSHLFVNKGILTRTPDTNIYLIGNGLVIDCNGIDGAQIVTGMQGHVAMFQVSNFLISGIKTDTITATGFFMHLAEVSNFIVRDIDAEGAKDGIHLGVASNFLFEDIRTSTLDDGIALNARDYAVSNPTLGDISNGIIRRWTDDDYVGQSGSGCLLLSGAWSNWASGTTYQCNDIVINAGNIYEYNAAGSEVAANAPVHTSGAVTGADGIKWEWRQAGTIDHADVKDIKFEDCTWASRKPFIRTAGASDATSRAFFPGTGAQAIVDNIVIDNLTDTHVGGTELVRLDVNVGTFEIKNTPLNVTHGWNPVAVIEQSEVVAIDKLIFNNCDTTLNTDEELILMPGVITYPYSIKEVEIIDSEITNNDATRSCLFGMGDNVLNLITLTNTVFHYLKSIITTPAIDSFDINIVANGCTFDQLPERLIQMYNTTNSVVNFTADGCTFEETSEAMFENNQASSQLNIITTNSLGESIPQLKSGTVDVTASDLVLGLGDNVCINGKFRESVYGWSASTGAVEWDATECLKFTASGAGAAGILRGVANPLSDNIRLTFKAKSPTLTVTLRSPYNPNTLTPVANPAMTTAWQTYVFEGARGAAAGGLYILSATDLANGDIIYFDDITVVQY